MTTRPKPLRGSAAVAQMQPCRRSPPTTNTNGAPKSHKVGVKTPGDQDWVYNSLRFHTVVEAERYGADLFSRWTAVKEYQVHPSEDAPNTDGTGNWVAPSPPSPSVS